MADVKHFDPETALDRAMTMFWRQGYEATSIGHLVAELGLSRSSLYATFGDKQALFLAALARYRRLEAGPRHAALTAEAPVLDTLHALLQDIAAAPSVHPDQRGCLIVNAAMERIPADPATAAVVAEQLEHFEAALATALRRGQARGELDDAQDTTALARFLVTLVQGMRVVGKAGADPTVLQDVIDVAMGAIRPRPGL